MHEDDSAVGFEQGLMSDNLLIFFPQWLTAEVAR